MEILSQAIGPLIGAIGGILALLVQHRLQRQRPAPRGQSRRAANLSVALPLYVLIGVLIGTFSGMLIERSREDPPASRASQTPAIRIESPAGGAPVAMEEMIRGFSRNVTDGDSVWVVVYIPRTARFYPQDRPADVQAGGGWNSVARLGVEGDGGLLFDVLAVSADANARAAFRRYLDDGRATGRWDGMSSLPAGAREFHRVTVRRQP